MLILTRRIGETLTIGDDITVTVLGVKGNQIRIGVGAPSAVAVPREAIYNRIAAERAMDPKFDLSRVLAIRRAAQLRWLPRRVEDWYGAVTGRQAAMCSTFLSSPLAALRAFSRS